MIDAACCATMLSVALVVSPERYCTAASSRDWRMDARCGADLMSPDWSSVSNRESRADTKACGRAAVAGVAAEAIGCAPADTGAADTDGATPNKSSSNLNPNRRYKP